MPKIVAIPLVTFALLGVLATQALGAFSASHDELRCKMTAKKVICQQIPKNGAGEHQLSLPAVGIPSVTIIFTRLPVGAPALRAGQTVRMGKLSCQMLVQGSTKIRCWNATHGFSLSDAGTYTVF